MMRRFLIACALVATPAIAAPVEVTRFHTSEAITALGLVGHGGAVFVTGVQGTDPTSLVNRPWFEAIERELAGQGWGFATAGAADRVVEVDLQRETIRRERERGPVSVGVGGSTGRWNSGVGLGVGFDLGGGPKDLIATRLRVVIKDRASGRALWEGRAENVEKAGTPLAQAEPAARRMAHALFAGFPGRSGDTIKVK